MRDEEHRVLRSSMISMVIRLDPASSHLGIRLNLEFQWRPPRQPLGVYI